MTLYAYIGAHKLGSEPLGTMGKWIWRDLKTVKGAVNRINRLYPGHSFQIYRVAGDNIYDDSKMTLAFEQECAHADCLCEIKGVKAFERTT